MRRTGSRSNLQGMGTLVFMLVGPIVWTVHLTLIYGSQSLLCALNLGEDRSAGNAAIIAIILVATAVCIAAVGFSAARPGFVHALIARADLPADQAGFIVTIMRVLAWLSILAMLYAGLGAVILPACGQLR
ncbi:hypothetical protein [Nitrosovibrio sp. Nv4]|uniref:hypothetical protein n=1 Tax=Nitrosovibrio sp. Nv4 TaxID=1945880 RepID=UPI000BC91A70|nr:hypothetical protein [Nitrosovibrio sp. Nv4]SOD41863.1 hypothetical protein SAMN06298226_2174 [Nitrosovibrio sp. Nv4]